MGAADNQSASTLKLMSGIHTQAIGHFKFEKINRAPNSSFFKQIGMIK